MFRSSLYGPLVDGAVSLILSQEQYTIWEQGSWDAYRIEQDLLEHVDALGLRCPVVALRPDRSVAFAITPPRRGR